MQYLRCHMAKEHMRNPGMAMRPHDNEVDLSRSGSIDNHLGGHTGKNGRITFESCCSYTCSIVGFQDMTSGDFQLLHDGAYP